MYKFRLILDTKEDVIREIAIAKDFTLEDLHETILNAFGFKGNEMASFYHTDNDWNQGDEIPLFNMSEQVGGLTQMRDYKIELIFNATTKKMIYVYDFLNLWTFFIEYIENFNTTKDKSIPLLLFSLGELPKEAPKKEFEIQSNEDDDAFDIFDGDEEFDEY
ncbi:MAG: plasmid pRiA4b ORF-3 family protein [Flavobacteriaceae bacterium]|nr:plasmid pRiA4b ORF-3 family protein [Flavobacteriaceae bacterium]